MSGTLKWVTRRFLYKGAPFFFAFCLSEYWKIEDSVGVNYPQAFFQKRYKA